VFDVENLKEVGDKVFPLSNDYPGAIESSRRIEVERRTDLTRFF